MRVEIRSLQRCPHLLALSVPWAIVLLAACGALFTPGGSVEIRIVNNSDHVLEQVTVDFPSQQEQYGAVLPRSSSEYRTVDEAYRYAAIHVQLDDRELRIQPIDYVGESLLQP